MKTKSILESKSETPRSALNSCEVAAAETRQTKIYNLFIR
jgi:hypothetical protein